ncbi:unnamed protein product, partial [Didymodactylos carnosus]
MLRPEQTDVPVIYESLELHRTDPMHTDKIHHHITPPANIDVVEERYEVIICEREKPNDEQLTVREETALLNEH